MWDDLTVTGDLQLFANWIQVIDMIQITFDIPNVGDPMPNIKLPEEATYINSECHMTDEEYYSVEVIEKAGTYNISLFLLAIPGESVFAEMLDEIETPIYNGTVTVNGELWESYEYEFYEDPIVLAVFMVFTVE